VRAALLTNNASYKTMIAFAFLTRFIEAPNHARGCVKRVGVKFGNDQIFDMENFDEVSRRIEWSKNEFSHSLSPEPTAVGAVSSAVAVRVTSRRWLSFLR
jgi:hypothetical protein